MPSHAQLPRRPRGPELVVALRWHVGNVSILNGTAQTAASKGAQLVVLPEMWHCPYSNDSFPKYAEDIDGGDCPSVKALQGELCTKSFQIL